MEWHLWIFIYEVRLTIFSELNGKRKRPHETYTTCWHFTVNIERFVIQTSQSGTLLKLCLMCMFLHKMQHYCLWCIFLRLYRRLTQVKISTLYQRRTNHPTDWIIIIPFLLQLNFCLNSKRAVQFFYEFVILNKKKLTSVWKVQNRWHRYGCFVPRANTFRSINVHSTSSSSRTTSFFKHFTA